jgi:hypothetical protein
MARLTEYDDDQVANALAVLHANNGNALKTSELLGIPRSTIRSWAGQTQYTPKSVPNELVQDKTMELAHNLEAVAFMAVGEGLEEAILKASAKDRMIVAGIAIEKRQLLIGAPTSRNASVVIHLAGAGSLRELADRTLSGTNTPVALGPGSEDVSS